MSVQTATGSNSTIAAVILAAMVSLAAGAISTAATAGNVHAPLGYQVMCLKNPGECQGGGKAKVTVTADVMSTLKRVNGHVNRTIKPRYDSGADVWSASATSGDCEDYVLAKRKALI